MINLIPVQSSFSGAMTSERLFDEASNASSPSSDQQTDHAMSAAEAAASAWEAAHRSAQAANAASEAALSAAQAAQRAVDSIDVRLAQQAADDAMQAASLASRAAEIASDAAKESKARSSTQTKDIAATDERNDSANEASHRQTQAFRPLRFTGTLKTYYALWLKNTLFTLLSLGLYGPWAHVQQRRYLFRHTQMGGTGFDYHGKGKDLFKLLLGGLMLFALVNGGYQYLISPDLKPGAGVAASLVLTACALALVGFAIRYRSRNSSWHGIRARWAGSSWGMIRHVLGGQLLTLVSVGLAYPLVVQVVTKWQLKQVRIGDNELTPDISLKGFWTLCAPWMFAPIILAFALPVAMSGNSLLALYLDPQAEIIPQTAIIASTLLWLLFLPRFWSFAGLGLLAGSLSFILSNNTALMLTMAASLTFGFYLCYSMARLSMLHLVLRNLSFRDHVQFSSSLRIPSLFALAATNLLAIFASLGLATPWAELRLQHYLCNNIHYKQTGPLDDLFDGQTKGEPHEQAG